MSDGWPQRLPDEVTKVEWYPMDKRAERRRLALRHELLAASGHYSGVTAGLDTDRIVVMPKANRGRLLLVHKLVCDLLDNDTLRAAGHLRSYTQLEVELAVLRGTVLSVALQKEMANNRFCHWAVLQPSAALTASLSALFDVTGLVSAAGYTAYMEHVWDNPALKQSPIIDLVVDFLDAAEGAEVRGAAVGAAVVYSSHLRYGEISSDAVRKEQLALMAAFIDAGALTFRNNQILIP